MSTKPFDYIRVASKRVVIDDDEQTNAYADVRELIRLDGERLGILGQTFVWRGTEYHHDEKSNKVRIVARVKGSKRFVDGEFWHETRDKDTGQHSCKIHYKKFIDFLKGNGFGRRLLAGGMGYDYVRVVGNQIEALHHNIEAVQHFVNEYLEDLGDENAQDMMMRGSDTHYRDSKLRNLPPIDLDPVADTMDTAWLFYRNTALRITADRLETIPYDKLPGQVWTHQILDRDFHPASIEELIGGHWCQFQACVFSESRAEGLIRDALTKTPDELSGPDSLPALRLLAGMIGYGYLLHGFKDPAVTKAIVSVDRTVARSLGEANGGSGKSMSIKALGNFIERVEMPGRSFKLDKNFLLQRVTHETRLLHMPDLHAKFDMGDIFNFITEDIEIERKGLAPFVIPYAVSPKWALDTNFVPKGDGAAFRRRTHLLEYSGYFSDAHTPLDEFGRRFFLGWTNEDWRLFDAFYHLAIQRFLRFGLVPFPAVNWQERITLRDMPEEAIAFFDDFVTLGQPYIIAPVTAAPGSADGISIPTSLLAQIRVHYSEEIQDINPRALGRWMRRWAEFKGYHINGVPAGSRKEETPQEKINIGGKRVPTFTFTKPT